MISLQLQRGEAFERVDAEELTMNTPVTQNDKELEGTLIGVDELVNMVMEDVVELILDPTTGTSKEVGRIDEILLNGNNVAMIVKGGRPK